MFPSLFISHGSPMLALEPGESGPALARLAAEKETATTMTHPGNPIGGILSRKIALLRRIAFAALVTLLVAAIIALLLSDALRSQ